MVRRGEEGSVLERGEEWGVREREVFYISKYTTRSPILLASTHFRKIGK